MGSLTASLAWIGVRARWILPIGCFAALLLPELSALMRPILPGLVVMVLTLSMIRIDLQSAVREALRPSRFLHLVLLTLLMMPLTGLILWGGGQIVGLNGNWRDLLVIFAASPPIASAAALCFLLGFDAAFAVTLTVLATFLTPLLGPLVVEVFFSSGVSVPPLTLGLRLSMIVLGGAIAALIIRSLAGAERIARNTPTLDGISALGMVLFVIPLFDGALIEALRAPEQTMMLIVGVFALNWGMNLWGRTILRRGSAGDGQAGAFGIMTGNRTVAIYAAVLPHDPFMMLFIAFYQFPMYLTPLVFGRKRPALKGKQS